MRIKFEKLIIENFKGIKWLEIKFGSQQTTVYGANETGKTTVADAIAYVLTGKNSLGESTFEILPIGKENVTASAVLDLVLDDGTREKPVQLSRSYAAQFNRNKEYTGEHKTVCTINGIATGPRDFDKWIADNICQPEIFRLIHDVKYFTENIQGNGKEKAWEAQRRLIMSVCGGEDDYTYAQSKDSYKELLDGLARYDSASQYLVYLKSKEKDLEKAITEHNGSIAFVENVVNNRSERNPSEIQTEIDTFSNEFCEIQNSLDNLTEDKRQEIVAKSQKIKAEYQRQVDQFEAMRKEINDKHYRISVDMQALANNKIILESRLKQLNSNDGLCKTCGQLLPKEAVQKNQDEAKELSNEIANIDKEIASLKQKLNALPTKIQAVEYPEELDKLNNEAIDLHKDIENSPASKKMEEIRLRIEDLTLELSRANEVEKLKKEIEERKEFLKAALDDRATIRKMIDLCSQFIQDKCNAVTEKINGMFEGITFNMFHFNKTNDEMKECCDIFFNGVPYQSLSYSTKFYVSLQIALGFQKIYDIYMPVVIDNAESIDIADDFGVQMIKLEKKEELCPKCGMWHTGRKNPDGTWICLTCGNTFVKTLEIEAIS